LQIDSDDLSLQAQLVALRKKIVANRELVTTLRGVLAKSPPETRKNPAAAPRSPIKSSPTPGHPARDARLVEVLLRQANDSSLRDYPGLALKVVARLGTRKLTLARPDEQDLRQPGALLQLLRKHLREAGRADGAGRYAVLRAWMRALSSIAAERLRGRPSIPPEFDETSYLLLHEDVAETVAAGGLPTGYEHWLRYGKAEGRLVHFDKRRGDGVLAVRVRPRPDVPSDFDEDAYLSYNADVQTAVTRGLFPSGYAHWSASGRKEARGGGPWEPLSDRSGFMDLMQSRSYGVNLYGFLSNVSGLGSVARSCLQAINTAEIPVHAIDIPGWNHKSSDRTLPSCSPYRINLIQQNADMLSRFAGAYGTGLLNGCYNIGYWLWELPSVRADWYHLYRYVDEVWVASEFCRHAFQTLTRRPVIRVPLVVDGLEAKAVYPREHFQFPANAFVFGYIFDVSSYMERKNPLCLIEAFKREFGASRDVLLYLKFFNSGYDEDNVRILNEAIAGAPNIRTFTGMMTQEEIASLQKAMDCLVSPHRSEGFGYNLAEMMYFGKPVIATGYSSNLDFMREDNSYLIDYSLVPITRNVGPYQRGNVWADPSVEHLASLMRKVFEDTSGREEKGRRAAEEIRQNYSTQAVGRIMAARFDELGLREPHLPRTLLPAYGPLRQLPFFHPDTPAKIAEEIRSWSSQPMISIVTPVYNVAGMWLERCIESVRHQYYPRWELCLCDDGSTNAETLEILESYRGMDPRIKIVRLEQSVGIAEASNRAAEISSGDFLAMLDNDDEIAPEALFEIARAIQSNPDVDFLYTDEDKIDEDGDIGDHYCKPDWSPEHLLSVMYVLHMLVVRKDLFYAAGQFRSEFSGARDYDLALRLATLAQCVHHVPKVLYHSRKIEGSAAERVDAKPAALDAGLRALENHIQRNGIDAWVEEGLLPGLFRVRNRIRDNPLASLCILASGREAMVAGRGTINLVGNFVRSIVERTLYPNYEIVVVDDGTLPESTRQALKGLPYRSVSFSNAQGPLNFAKKANFAFRQARGRYIVLLNDDMEVISSEWLDAMLEPLQQDAVGVVGAKLLFPDETIQHAGVVLGPNGGVAHVYYGYSDGMVGYNAFTHVIRNYSAVTAACMATRIDVLQATGGFDEELAVDYNDIDFCLSAIEQGYRVVYTPYAKLYHFERTSVPRTTQDPKEVKLFRDRWARYLQDDPFYNPNLTRSALNFSLSREVGGYRNRRVEHAKRKV
jgi:GT2 family glycosyltransferase/glycosyltransferase involved in cell wall biosynthesis